MTNGFSFFTTVSNSMKYLEIAKEENERFV